MLFVRFYGLRRRLCPKFEIMSWPSCGSTNHVLRTVGSDSSCLLLKMCAFILSFLCANATILPSRPSYIIIIKPATQCSSFPTKHWWNDSEDADVVDDCNGRLVSALSQLGPPPRARDLGGKLQLPPDDALTAVE